MESAYRPALLLFCQSTVFQSPQYETLVIDTNANESNHFCNVFLLALTDSVSWFQSVQTTLPSILLCTPTLLYSCC